MLNNNKQITENCQKFRRASEILLFKNFILASFTKQKNYNNNRFS